MTILWSVLAIKGKIMGQIYAIKQKPENKIVYIGQTIRTYKIRWQQHKQQMKERKYALYNAMNKYGIENFYPVLVEECENDKLDERERYWIKYYHTKIEENGYNLTDGGDTPSQQMCIPVHQYTLTGEYVVSYPSIIEASYTLNIPYTSIWRVVNGFLQQTHNFRWSKEKLKCLKDNYKTRLRSISQYDLNNNFLQSFDSIRAAAMFMGKPNGSRNIQLAARGERQTAYGYKWKFN